MEMPFPVPSWKQKSLWLGRVIFLQPDSEIFNDRDGSRCQLALSVALADYNLWAHSAPAIVNVSRLQGDAFIDAAGSIHADSEQGTVSQREERKSFGKEALNLCLGEYFRPSMTVNLHPSNGNTSLK
jgi:hypothetical protein